jgi:hypothetical protein
MNLAGGAQPRDQVCPNVRRCSAAEESNGDGCLILGKFQGDGLDVVRGQTGGTPIEERDLSSKLSRLLFGAGSVRLTRASALDAPQNWSIEFLGLE